MHTSTLPTHLAAPPGKALLVIMRPSNFGFAVRFTLVNASDQRAPQFLGQPLAQSAYAVALPPGDYRLVAWAENADSVQATLAAGKVYYVLASVRMGAWRARVGLTALTPRSGEWAKREEWLHDATYYTVDQAGGQAEIASNASDVQEKLRDAAAAWLKYDDPHRDERILNAEDGL